MTKLFSLVSRAAPLLALSFLFASGLFAQNTGVLESFDRPLPDAPGAGQRQQQSSQTAETGTRPDPKIGESSVPQQNSASTPVAKEQPKRILFVIPNYRAVSADARVAPLDAKGKFRLFTDDSFDYGTFVYVGFLSGIGMAQNSVRQFGDGADAFSRYYYHSFADQALGNFFTELTLPIAFHQDPRYFTLGRGGLFKRSGYALSRLVVTRTDGGSSALNFSEIVGNGAAAGISGLYYPSQYRTWTKTGQRWSQQLALDAFFNVVKEFWPDIRHAVLHQQ